jgi:hypothetical protein
MTKDDFEAILRDKPVSEFVQEYLFDGTPWCFSSNPQVYHDFRKEICNQFRIHPRNFTVVGSAKLGFSLAPHKYGRPFSDDSDIDVVLVSDDLYQELWLQLIEFRKSTWYALSRKNKENFSKLQSSMFYGSIRFDQLTSDFNFARDWWKFFNTLSRDSRFGPRRIRAMIFKSWRHVSIYYEGGIEGIARNSESNSQ